MCVLNRNFPDPSLRLSLMDRNTLSSLLNPLLRLRQSCCHPQAVRGQFISLQGRKIHFHSALSVATMQYKNSQ